MSFAHIVIEGFLGKDPITRAVSDTTVTSVRVAVTRKYKREGQPQESTTWWSAQLWGAHGAAVQKYLKKGDPIILHGWPEQETWKDNDGVEHTTCKIQDASWSFAAGKRDAAPTEPAAQQTSAPAPSRPSSDAMNDQPPF